MHADKGTIESGPVKPNVVMVLDVMAGTGGPGNHILDCINAVLTQAALMVTEGWTVLSVDRSTSGTFVVRMTRDRDYRPYGRPGQLESILTPAYAAAIDAIIANTHVPDYVHTVGSMAAMKEIHAACDRARMIIPTPGDQYNRDIRAVAVRIASMAISIVISQDACIEREQGNEPKPSGSEFPTVRAQYFRANASGTPNTPGSAPEGTKDR